MYEWLLAEMARVKTRKFYLTDGPLPTQKVMEDSKALIPPSYKAFILQFGNANLYRKAGDTYLVRVYANPREVESNEGEPLLHFGRTDLSLAYFKRSLLVPGGESPVFVWRHHQGFRREAEGFEEWLGKSCKAAKNRFKKREWDAIQKGPAPFDERENGIIKARRKFDWRVVGTAANGDLLFEVHNGSEMTLPFLSIGVRKKNGEHIGSVGLAVFSLLPGQTVTIQQDCYKDRHPPETIEVFLKPDPEPEDRDVYWEFRPMPFS